HRLGEGLPLANGNRSKLETVGDVAYGVYVRHARPRIFIDDHMAVPAQLDAGRLQAETGDIGPPPGGVHDEAGRHTLTVPERQIEAARRLVDPRDVGHHAHVDTLAHHFLVQQVAQVVVEAAQNLLAAIKQFGAHAEPIEDAGELDCNVATAHDGDFV